MPMYHAPVVAAVYCALGEPHATTMRRIPKYGDLEIGAKVLRAC